MRRLPNEAMLAMDELRILGFLTVQGVGFSYIRYKFVSCGGIILTKKRRQFIWRKKPVIQNIGEVKRANTSHIVLEINDQQVCYNL